MLSYVSHPHQRVRFQRIDTTAGGVEYTEIKNKLVQYQDKYLTSQDKNNLQVQQTPHLYLQQTSYAQNAQQAANAYQSQYTPNAYQSQRSPNAYQSHETPNAYLSHQTPNAY